MTLINKLVYFNQKPEKRKKLRRKIAKIIRGYRNGGSIEALSHENGLNKSAVWRYLKNSFAYSYLKARRVRKYSRKKDRHVAPFQG
jgi:hypothetical protein